MDCRYDRERGRSSCCDDDASIVSSEAHSSARGAPRRANSASTTASTTNANTNAAAAAGVFVLSKSGPSWISDRQFSINSNGSGHHPVDRPASRSSSASSNAWAAVPTPSPRYVGGGGGRRTPGRPSEDNMTRPSIDSMRSVSVSSWAVLPDEKRKSQLRASRMIIDSPNASPAPGLLVNLHGSEIPHQEGLRSSSGGDHHSNSGNGNSIGRAEHLHGKAFRDNEEPRTETPRFFAQRFYDIPDSAPATKDNSPVDEHPRRRRLIDMPVSEPAPEPEAEIAAPFSISAAPRASWEAEREFWTPTRSPSAAAMLRPSPSSFDSSLLMPPADIGIDDPTNSNNVWASRGPSVHSRPLVLPQVATLAASKRQPRSRAASLRDVHHHVVQGEAVSQTAGPLHAQYNAGPSPATQRLARVRSHSTIQQERWSRSDLASNGGSVSAYSEDEDGGEAEENARNRLRRLSRHQHRRDDSASGASSDAYDGVVVSAPAQLIQVAKKSIARTDAILLVGRGAKRYAEAGIQVIPQGALACPRVSVTAATPSTQGKETPLATRRAKPQLTIDTVMKKGSVESTTKTAPLLQVPANAKSNGGNQSATLPPTPVTLQCPKCQHQFDWVAGKDASPARSAKSLAEARVEARSAMRSTSIGQLEELAAGLPPASQPRDRSAAASPSKHRNTRSADGPHGASVGIGSFSLSNESRSATPLEGLDYHGAPTTTPKMIGSLKSRFDPSFQRNVTTPDQHQYPERSTSRSSFTESFIKLRHHRDSAACLPLSNKTESSLTLNDSRPTSSSGSSIASNFTPVALHQMRHTRASSKSSQTAAETASISSSNRGVVVTATAAAAATPHVHHIVPTPDVKPINEVCPWEDEVQPPALPTSAPVVEDRSGQEADEWDAAINLPATTPRTPSKSKALKLLGIPDGAANELPPPLPATTHQSKKSGRRRGSNGAERRLSITHISAPFGVTHSPTPLSRPVTSSSTAPSLNLAGIGSAANGRNSSRLNTGMSSTSSAAATTGSTTPSGSSVDTGSQGREESSYESRAYGLTGPATLVPPALLPPPQIQQPSASTGLGKLRNAWKRGGTIASRTSSTASQPGAALAGTAAIWAGETPVERKDSKDSKELGPIPSFPLPPSPQPQASPGQSSSGASMQTATPATVAGGRTSMASLAAQQPPSFRLPSLDLLSPAEQDDFASMAAAAASYTALPPPPPFSEAIAEGRGRPELSERSPASAVSTSSPASGSSGVTATLMQRESPVRIASTTAATATLPSYLATAAAGGLKASTSHHDGGAALRAQQQLRERDKALSVLRRRREAETHSSNRQSSSQAPRERGSMDWNPRVDYL